MRCKYSLLCSNVCEMHEDGRFKALKVLSFGRACPVSETKAQRESTRVRVRLQGKGNMSVAIHAAVRSSFFRVLRAVAPKVRSLYVNAGQQPGLLRMFRRAVNVFFLFV
jgi:hypothetical protein